MDTTRRVALAAFLTLPGFVAAQPATIQGTAIIRERMALPPGLVLEVALLDASRADAPAETIATTRIPVTGQPPLAFALAYDAARIAPGRRHVLQARLLRGEEALFRTDRIHQAFAGGPDARHELLLVRAARGATADAPASPVGPAWVVEDIGGRGVVDRARTDLVLSPEGRAAGHGGCNRFTGGYTLDGASLRFGALAATRMACAPALMDQERRFFAAMAEVRGWRFEQGRLLLTDAGGGVLLRLSR